MFFGSPFASAWQDAAGAVPGVGDLEGVVAADRIVAGGALRAPDVRHRADVGLAVVFVADVDRRAELDRAGGEVVHVLERRLARRDRRVDAGLGLAAAVAGLADVVEPRLLPGDARGKRHRGHRDDRREVGAGLVVAGAAFEAVGGLRDHLAEVVLDVEAEAVLAPVARRAGRVDLFALVPVAGRLARAVEVADVGAGRLAHVDLGDQHAVDVGDRVVEQLDDVLRVVGERARILAGHLVVVGGAQQARGPAGERVGGHRLGGRAAAVAVAVDEPVRVAVDGVADRRAVLRTVRPDRRAQLVAQADQLVVDPLAGVAVAVVVDADRRHHPDLVRAADVGDAGVAAGAGVELDPRRVRVVTADAGVVAVDVAEANVVDLTGVLVAALRAPREQRGGGREEVDVLEVERGADGVVGGRGGRGDRGVDGGARRCAPGGRSCSAPRRPARRR